MDTPKIDKRKFDSNGINVLTGTRYDKNGFDVNGFNERGMHMETGTYYNLYGYDKDGYNREGYNYRGYDRKGYNKDGYDENGIDEYGMSQKTGEIDTRILLAKKFIASGLTIDEFSKEIERKAESVRKVLDSLTKSPCISEELTAALDKSNAVVSEETIELKKKLLAGEVSIKDVGDIDYIINACTIKEKQEVRELLIRGANSHTIRILEYKKIYGINEDGKELPQRIIDRVAKLVPAVKRSTKQEIRSMGKGIENEIKRIEAYKSPFQDSDLKRLGYVDKKGVEHWIEISPELIELAKQYLTATGEFICYKTMSDVFKEVLHDKLSERKLKLVVGKTDKKEDVKDKDKGKEEPEQ